MKHPGAAELRDPPNSVSHMCHKYVEFHVSIATWNYGRLIWDGWPRRPPSSGLHTLKSGAREKIREREGEDEGERNWKAEGAKRKGILSVSASQR